MDGIEFYATPGRMTGLGPHTDALSGIGDLRDAAEVVQGLILHVAWAPRYGVDLSQDDGRTLQTRSAIEMLDAVIAIDPSPLDRPRPADRRMVGNCRHFATLTCAVLRAAGTPVRARCGFGTYFEAGKHVDHWIAEVRGSDRWTRADTQIDDVQRGFLGIDDPLHLSDGLFLDGAEAWTACRNGNADPDTFGIADMWGLWFARGNVTRDLAAINKVEVLPWDAWGVMLDGETSQANDGLLDEIAATVRTGSITDVRALYDGNDRLRVGKTVTSFGPGGAAEVTIADGKDAHGPR